MMEKVPFTQSNVQEVVLNTAVQLNSLSASSKQLRLNLRDQQSQAR